MNGNNWERGFRASAATAFVWFMVVLVISGLFAWMNSDNTSAKNPSATVSSIPTPLVQASCQAAFVQKDETDPALARFIKGGVDSATAKESSQKILDAAGHNAAYLNLLAKDAFNLPNVPATADMLTSDGTCLSEAGRQVYHDLGVVMSASGQQFSEAPATGYNSGMINGIPVIDPNPGISGPKKAVLYTLPNGTKVYIMVRCGNPVFVRPPPNIPHGCTDNGGCKPPTVCTHNCGPVCTTNCHPCPPGEVRNPNGVCLLTKPRNPKDWTYPTGKPPATVTTPGDSSPPKVTTTQSGGGGVVDTPTNTPGSETGGQAPGASTPPSSAPTQPPATGANDGSGGTITNPFQ